MTLPLLVYRSLRQHALSSLVTACSLALAGGLLMTVWMVNAQAKSSFIRTTTSFDAVLGARGSKLQLVLNALFHLEASPGNLQWSDYESIRRNPAVAVAIPIAVGDNLRNFRLVGTIPEIFDVEYSPGRRYRVEPGGRVFSAAAKEAVVGSVAAARLGLSIGSTFHPFHGLAYNPAMQHSEVFTVTGLLEPTGTPLDRVILIPIHGLQTLSGHDPRAATDISAVLIKLKSPAVGFMMDMLYNRQGNRLTFAFPVGAIVADLFDKIDWFSRVLQIVAFLVAVVAAASVLASIYASMSARRRDIAILRALGAPGHLIFEMVIAESACIGALGAVAGFAVYFALLAVIAGIIRAQTGVILSLTAYDRILVDAPAGLVVLCALGGLVPAMKALRTPVAENLSPLS